MRCFVLLGCNHSVASLDEIARAKLPEDDLDDCLRQIRRALEAEELVYLSTCHRTEWYLAYDGEMCPGRLTMALAVVLGEFTGGRTALPAVDHCLTGHGGEVARHLYRVCSALDSLMLGEAQVLGQVKDAFRRASQAGVVGPRLTTLFTQAFRTAKRVRTETSLSRRPVSLISLAERRLRVRLTSDHAPVAILGAGEMAGLAAEMIRKLDEGRQILLFNRGVERGRSLASRVGAEFHTIAGFPPTGARFAAVIAATSTKAPIVTGTAAQALAPVLLLDLGMPANVAPECAAVAGIEVVDQATLRAEAEENRAARAEELSKAEAIVEEQLQELAYEVMEHELSPVARKLVAAFRELTRNELERVVGDGGGLAAGRLDEAAERLSQRLVRLPMRGLREVAWQHSTDVLATFLAAVKQ